MHDLVMLQHTWIFMFIFCNLFEDLQYPANPNDKTYQLYPMPVINLNIEDSGALANTAGSM